MATHHHDYKFIGTNPKAAGLNIVLAGKPQKVYRCYCGSVQIKGS